MPPLARRAALGLALVLLLPPLASPSLAAGPAAVIGEPQVETLDASPERTVIRVTFPVLVAPPDWARAGEIEWRGLVTQEFDPGTDELRAVAPAHGLLVAVADRAAAPGWRVVQAAWHRAPADPAASPVRVAAPAVYRGVPLAPVVIAPTAGDGILSGVVVEIRHPSAGKAAPVDDPRLLRRLAAEDLPGAVANPDLFRRLRAIAAASARPAAKAPLPDWFGLTDHWVRLHVDAEAIYAVTGAELEAMGVVLADIDPDKLRVFKGGGLTLDENPEVGDDAQADRTGLTELAIALEGAGDGEFNLDDRILFYGFGTDIWRDRLDPAAGRLDFFNHPHQDLGVYWLTWEDHATSSPLPGTPRRIATVAAAPTGGQQVTTHRARYHGEQNQVYAGGYVRDNWVWNGSVISLFSATVDLGGVLAGQTAEWQVDVCGLYSGSFTARYEGRIWLNNDTAGAVPYEFPISAIINQERVRFSGTSTALRPGSNTFRVSYDNYPTAQSLLGIDSFDLQYTASLDRNGYDGALACVLWGDDVTAPGTAYDLVYTLRDGTAPLLWDVTRPDSVVALQGQEAGAGPRTLTVGILRDPGADRHLWLFTADETASVVRGERAQPRPLRQTVPAADYLVIHTAEFAAAAATLADLRSRVLPGVESPSAVTVDVRDIYDSFAGGQKDWRAIRQFLRWHWLAHGQRLRWVCLLGDGTRDYRNFLGHDPRTELVDHVPTALMTDFPPSLQIPFPTSTRAPYVADDMLVSFDDPDAAPNGIDIPDVAIGRLPANSAEEARRLVERVVAYVEDPEPGLWGNRVVWSADDLRYRGEEPGPIEHLHALEAEDLAHNYLPVSLDIEKVYLMDYPLVGNFRPEARRDLLARLSEGASIFYYVGHGAANVLADEQVFRTEDISGLTNGGRRFLFMAFSCDVGVFDDPTTPCMAEEFLAGGQGGGIAAISASWVSTITNNDLLSESFARGIYPRRNVDPTATLAEALNLAKADNWQVPSRIRNNKRYNVLGDPALVLNHPPDDVAFTATSADSLLTGRVHAVALDLDQAGLPPGSDLTYELRAEENHVDVPFVDAIGRTWFWRRLGNTVFRGTGVMEQVGQEIVFRAPLSMRNGEEGRLRCVLTRGNEQRSAVVRLPVAQVPASTGGDVTGPTITMGFGGNGIRVRPGDELQATLADTAGISILASNPANSVLLEFDRSGIYNDVSDAVVFDPGSYTRATLNTALPADLSLGEHSVVLTASDMFGNVGSDTVSFVLEAATVAALRDATVFPNPTPGPCRLVCDLSGPMDVQWDIYTVSGRRVRSLRASFVAAGPAVLEWDGRDGEGDTIANGTYLYVLRGTPSGDSHEIRQTGQLVIMQ